MFESKATKIKFKCPLCEHTLEFHEVKFSVANDKGEKIVKCNSCNKNISIECLNPRESRLVSGAKETEFIEYDEYNRSSSYPKVKKAVVFNDNYFGLNHSYDLDVEKLYRCECNECNLEKLAYMNFDQKWDDKLDQEISKYYTVDLAGHGCNPENAVIKIQFITDCGKDYSALFFSEFSHNLGFENFKLGAIPNSLCLEEELSGVFSKKQTMDLLKKLITRWGLFYEKVLIVAPYIESSYVGSEKITDTLLGIIKQFPKNKEAKIHTRAETITKFKNAVSESFNLDYSFLEDYDLGIPAIDDSQKKKDSHAKMYIGVSQDKAEIFSGSANLANGPSVEVMNYRKIPTDKLNTKYLNHYLKKPLIFKVVRSDVIFDENNQFKARELNKEELYSYL